MSATLPRQHSTLDISAATIADVQTIADQLYALHGDAARLERAVALLLARKVHAVGYGAYHVASCEPDLYYAVVRGLSCSCPDRQKRETYCKHLLACDLLVSLGDLLTRRERQAKTDRWQAHLNDLMRRAERRII
jgi:hypothetical protein